MSNSVLVSLLLCLFSLVLVSSGRPSTVVRRKFSSGNNYVIIEVLKDSLAHFEYGTGSGPSVEDPIYTTHMVARKQFPGPTDFSEQGSVLNAGDFSISIAASTLCMTIANRRLGYVVTTTCPSTPFDQTVKNLTIEKASAQAIYGLGEQFFEGGEANGDYMGRVRNPGCGYYGNDMCGYFGGATGNAQFPVMYAVGKNNYQYAIFVDSTYRQDWNFQASPFTLNLWWGDQIRFYLIVGPDVPFLRSTYMDLVGRPPIPPKKVFGFWSGEYNTMYDSNMAFSKVKSLHSNGFPTDGLMLDVQWFGGVYEGSDNSPIGSLTFDQKFLDGRSVQAVLDDMTRQGLGVIPIEESYVAKNNNYSAYMQSKCYFARNDGASCNAVYFSKQAGDNCWWGNGYYIDWTNEDAGAFWHDQKRQPLADLGVVGYWTDLGEPEMFRASAIYSGFEIEGERKNSHKDIHNAYNLMWHKSIYDGYRRNKNQRRPFMVSRSGTSGVQRFGAAMWSGDIGSNFNSLGAHFNVHMHLSFSGIDYFSSDIGGFHRGGLDGDLNILYTRWYANSMWIDFPARAHTENLCNCKQVTPDKVGNLPSNLANTRQRYELVPYYYTLAYRAYAYGEPVVPPLAFYYQNDPIVQGLGHQKMIGRDLMFGIVASYNEYSRSVYLPAGTWINYNTNEFFSTNNGTSGAWLNNVPLFAGSLFRLPAFARAGAIIPKATVTDQTWNVFGLQQDGTYNTDFVVRVYQGTASSTRFDLYEDDGTTTKYEQGQFATTTIFSNFDNNTVYIGPVIGKYEGMLQHRSYMLEYGVLNMAASSVTINDKALPRYTSKKEYLSATEGFFSDYNMIYAKTSAMSTNSMKIFKLDLVSVPPASSIYFTCEAQTVPGEEIYVVGSSPRIGSWVASKGIKLEPNAYPVWTNWIQSFTETSGTVEWKCVKRCIDGSYVFSQGNNNAIRLTNGAAGGFQGLTSGHFY